MDETSADVDHSPEDELRACARPILLREQLLAQNKHGWRRIVLNFTPSWFSVNMGTGIVSILLHNLPYNGDWLRFISIAIFALNVVLFFTFLLISAVRYTLFRGLFTAMLRHPVQSLFLGTFPMGFATICNMFVFVCVPAWGSWALELAWAMFWVDSTISVVVGFFLPFAIMYIHDKGQDNKQLHTMTAVWLLPVVSTIVASATGGIVAQALAEHGRYQHSLWTLVASYILLGTGLPIAMVILVVYFQRLTMHRLPPQTMMVSVFLPLGPLGQGSYSLMQMGKVAAVLLPKIKTIPADSKHTMGQELNTFGIGVALIMWGFGLLWLFFAVASVTRHKFPFNMGKLEYCDLKILVHQLISIPGWWAFTFPLGVFTVSTTTLSEQLSSSFFKILGTIFSLSVLGLWLLVACKTTIASWKGTMFLAPCAKDFEEKWVEKQLEKFERES